MRKNVLPITASVLGSLAVAASADFTGFQTEMKGTYDTAGAFGGPDVGLVDVWNLYALFSDPNDFFVKVFVNAGEPGFDNMIHSSDLNEAFDGLGGGFWNWALGANVSLPAGGAYEADPAAGDADTYLTIGLKSGHKTVDMAFFAPGTEADLVASGILNGSGSLVVNFAYSVTPDKEQAFPVDGRVLVLQVAVRSGEHASGLWNISWGNTDPNIPTDRGSFQWTTVPAPGALALLGLAGLAGARRRRCG